MTAYTDALARLAMRGPGRMLPDLDRITALCDLLADPQTSYPSIHVTGTNGKGSVARMVSRLLHVLDLGVGTYTSPHLQDVRERIAAYGHLIPEDDFAAQVELISGLADVLDEAHDDPADHVTYFEILTAMAYSWFAELPVDVGVFEVGMGGRWDATNLVRGEVSVLTTIDRDHPELGDSPVQVATEKVGIIKPGAHVVTAEQQDAVTPVIANAVKSANARWWRAGEDFAVEDQLVGVGGQNLELRIGERVIDDVFVPVLGDHQADNAAVALAAAAAFLGDAWASVDDDLVRDAFGGLRLPGRLETVSTDPTIIVDGAHNPAGVRAVVDAVREFLRPRSTILVFGCLRDKPARELLEAFAPLVQHVVLVEAPSPRATPIDQLLAAATTVFEGTGVAVESATDLHDAVDLATGVVGTGDVVVASGSLYVAGGVRDRWLPADETLHLVVPLDDEDGGEDEFDSRGPDDGFADGEPDVT
ncbi:MAG: Mur ligase family protein [Nitriliruptorales bacterium]|nr:Mur ligase family protein [Nitriliruptorales bacterium]